ncbi:hypothetical protein JTB14_032423 [Gonioctena quinquepunctata]|nr:hypothetical protein JTB14_032423 [Gonioctena quinquepunctata]
MMEVQNSLLDKFEDTNDARFADKCFSISEDIKNNRLSILNLIEQLGDLLTNQSPSKRELGIAILSEVLNNLQSNLLTSQQLQTLASFYAVRFKDHHQVLPCTLKGILTIIEFDNFPGESVPALLNSLFQNVACQQQQQSDRYTIYCIFQILLRRFPSELLSMKIELVYGVLTAIDGERDPRNLLFLFKWLKNFLGVVKMGHLTEDMFDALSCYFPVDFRAPPSEKTITREALAEALCPCLCAIPDFGEHCIPLALEKLDSSLEIAKIDSLQLLKEIFNNNCAPGIKTECLRTLSDVINKISQDDEFEQYKDVLKNIIDTLKGNLLPESKLFGSSAQVLVHAALGSRNASNYVAEEIVPLLMNIYLMAGNPDQKTVMLKALVDMTKCFLKYHKSLDNQDNIPELSKVPLLCLESLNNIDCRININYQEVGFDSLAALAHCLSPEVRSKLYAHLRTSILTIDQPDLRTSMLECLKTMATCYGDELKERVFLDIHSDPRVVDKVLHAQCFLVNLNGYRDFVINSFLTCITNEEFSSVALKNLRALLDKQVDQRNLSAALIQKGLVDTLIELSSSHSNSQETLINISKVLKLLIGPQSSETQTKIVDEHLEQLYDKTVSSKINLILLDGMVSTLRKDIQVDYKVLELCLDIAIGQVDEVRETAVQLLANLINKRSEDELLTEYLGRIKDKCTESLKKSQSSSILTISWITKALLMRNHPQSMIWLDWLLGMIDEYQEVADGLKIIMNDEYESMSCSSNCNKSLLYRQKAFVHISNEISDNFDKNKIVNSKAMGYLIEFSPAQAVLLHFKKISRLIIMCLEKNKEPEVLCILLGMIKNVISDKNALIEEHLEDFLSRLLRLTSFESSMNVRLEALHCILDFTSSFPVYKLLPYKNDVLRELGQCIDDKKRLVRKEAMEARSFWFLLDAPQ